MGVTGGGGREGSIRVFSRLESGRKLPKKQRHRLESTARHLRTAVALADPSRGEGRDLWWEILQGLEQ